MDANELQIARLPAFRFKAKLYRFCHTDATSLDELMRHRGYIDTPFIPLSHCIKLARHIFNSTLRIRRQWVSLIFRLAQRYRRCSTVSR